MDDDLGNGRLDERRDERSVGLLVIAMYNAGPMRIRQLRREAARRGSRRNRH